MLDSIKNILFSTRLTAVLLFIVAFSIGAATFIENDFGTAASKSVVFNSSWFEVVLLLLVINFLGNIFKYKLYKKEKIPALIFHLAFIIIIVGAGVTRFISFEGLMHIREGEMSNTIVSADTYLKFKVDNKEIQYTYEKKLFLNPLYNRRFDHQVKFAGNEIEMSFNGFIPNAIDTVMEDAKGKSVIEIVTVGKSGRISRYISSGETKFFGNLPVAFNDTSVKEAIKLTETDSGVSILSPYDINYMRMEDQSTGVVSKDSLQAFRNRRLYSIDGIQMVFKKLHHNSIIKQVSAPKENTNGQDALLVGVKCNNLTKTIMLYGGKGYVANTTIFQMNDLTFSMNYGSKNYVTPFNIKLNDFKLKKYPGSSSPASYESEVTLIDNRFGGKEFDQRIFMNNVLDYDGYRFFQSSYDPDEMGTVLSVNHDFWGTSITYVGYFLLALGMIATLLNPKSRFSALKENIKKLRVKRMALWVVTMSLFPSFYASELKESEKKESEKKESEKKESEKKESEKKELVAIDAEHAEKFSRLSIQDVNGRMKPIHTFASEVLRKVFKEREYMKLTPEQVLLGMIHNPGYWREVPLIYINRHNERLKQQLNAEGNYVPFVSFFNKNSQYILSKEVSEANSKRPADRSQYDKDIIELDERVYICFTLFHGSILKIFPKEGDDNNTWYSSKEYAQFESQDSLFVKTILSFYLSSVTSAIEKGDWYAADSTLSYIDQYQRKYGKSVIPSLTSIDTEIMYNKVDVFNKLFKYYPLIGLTMMFILFSEIFKARKWKRTIVRILSILLFLLLLAHTLGLGVRWYISGHAPWSNGYEGMLLVSWVIVLMGFLFSGSNKMSLAAASILACVTLFVANLNFLNPQITPLVPVLNSYWLMIHVAIMVGSYAPLTLGGLLGFMILCLMIFKNSRNKEKINTTIKELTYTNEMNLTVGVFMAAVGTFLGAIWANESWGRYWGWDPKETWALVIVLYYAFVLHLRFIPKANGKYLFNLLSVIGIGVVIMTYFGVNYYLSGLHSYAAGDPVPIPSFVPITVIVVGITAFVAYIRNKRVT